MKWLRRTAYLLVGLFALTGLMVASLQSSWGQNLLRSLLVSALEQGGVKVQIGSVEGQLPQKLTFKKVEIFLADGSTLKIRRLLAKASLFRLLKNEISFTKLAGSGVEWKSGEKENSSLFSVGKGIPSLPMSLSVQSFTVSDVKIDEIGPIKLGGRIDIGARRHHLFVDLKATQGEDAGRVMVLAKRDGTAQWNIELDAGNVNAYYPSPIEGAVKLKFYAKTDVDKNMQGHFDGVISPSTLAERFQIPWSFKGRFTHKMGGDSLVSRLSVQSELGYLKGSVDLDPQGKIVSATGQFQTDHLVPARIFGRALLRKEGEQLIGKIVAQSPAVNLGPYEFKDVEIIADGTVDGQGTFVAKGNYSKQTWNGSGAFVWEKGWQLNNLNIDSPELKGTAFLAMSSEGMWTGTSDLNIENLNLLKPLLPNLDLFGQLRLKTTYDGLDLKWDMTATDLYIGPFYFKNAALYSDIHNPLNTPTGIASLDFEGGKFKGMNIDSALVETEIGGENWPYRLFAEGVWNRDFAAHLDGFWHLDRTDLTGSVEQGNGSFYGHPFSLALPVNFEWSRAKTEITTAQIDLPGSSVTGRLKRDEQGSKVYVRLEQFPLDFLSLNPLEISIQGEIDFEGTLSEKNRKTEAEFKAAVKHVEITELGVTNPINAESVFSGRLHQENLDFQGSLSARDEPLAALDFRIPVHLELWPWRFELLYKKPTKGHFSLNGRIEDFLDFFDLGPHWLDGHCNCNLKWSQTLKHPLIEGAFKLQNGFYENYYTGTELSELSADFVAEKDTLVLRSLQAKDSAHKGKLIGDGSIKMRLDERLPFTFNLAFQNFHFVQIDLVRAEANGAVEVTGTMDSALAKGEARIQQSQITIPERLARPLPNLQVVYRNAKKPLEPAAPRIYKPYPLHLDLQIHAPEGVHISGRGLQSEWKGDFVLGGTYTSPVPKGKLELIQGEFTFSGRFFTLTKGSLTFPGHEKEMPTLDLSGSMEQKGISIIANLRGPINSPQLTFQSIPPLPLSAIIAHLLFGQDISEINGLQALQLASSIANIAGEGPDVLETTRRSLGIDRLRIISSPGQEGSDTIAIQVGTYVAKGVIVSISQGTENSGPNISIEVDIGSGFFFQAESDQIHEQGKFAFKWNRNY